MNTPDGGSAWCDRPAVVTVGGRPGCLWMRAGAPAACWLRVAASGRPGVWITSASPVAPRGAGYSTTSVPPIVSDAGWMRVRKDRVADQAAGREVELAGRGLHLLPGGSGIDRRDCVAGRGDGEIAEVVALGNMGIRLRPGDRGRGDAEAVPGRHPVAAGHQPGVSREPGPDAGHLRAAGGRANAPPRPAGWAGRG